MLRSRRKETVKLSKVKTLLCTYVDAPDGCPYGDKCAFAHSVSELRKEGVGTPSKQSCLETFNSDTKNNKIECCDFASSKNRISRVDAQKGKWGTSGLTRCSQIVVDPGRSDNCSGENASNLDVVPLPLSALPHNEHFTDFVDSSQLQSIKETDLRCSTAHLPFCSINNLSRVNAVATCSQWSIAPPASAENGGVNYLDPHYFLLDNSEAITTSTVPSPPYLLPNSSPAHTPFAASSSFTQECNGVGFPPSRVPFQKVIEEGRAEEFTSNQPPSLYLQHQTTAPATSATVSRTDSTSHLPHAVKVFWNPSTRPFTEGSPLVTVGGSLFHGDAGIAPEFLRALPVPQIRTPSYRHHSSFVTSFGDKHPGMVPMAQNSVGNRSRSTVSSSSTSSSTQRIGGGQQNNGTTMSRFLTSSSSLLNEHCMALQKIGSNDSPESSTPDAITSFPFPLVALNTALKSRTVADSSNDCNNDPNNTTCDIPPSSDCLFSTYYNTNVGPEPSHLHDPILTGTKLGICDQNLSSPVLPSLDHPRTGTSFGDPTPELFHNQPFSPHSSTYPAPNATCLASGVLQEDCSPFTSTVPPVAHSTRFSYVSSSVSSSEQQGQQKRGDRNALSNSLPSSSSHAFPAPVDFFHYQGGWTSCSGISLSASSSPAASLTTAPVLTELNTPPVEALTRMPSTLSTSSKPFYGTFVSAKLGSSSASPQLEDKPEGNDSVPYANALENVASTKSVFTLPKRAPPCHIMLGTARDNPESTRRFILNIQHESACSDAIVDYPVEISDAEIYSFKAGATQLAESFSWDE